ncbi:MAG TPA: M14-type cytosolic carboxypeptidase [Bryobacteraceae bacterium]
MILLLASVALGAATIHTKFEGGALGEIKKISNTHFRLAVKGESDQDHRNRQANWYYFRVDEDSEPLTLDIVNLPGEYNYKPNRGAVTKDTPPVISYDGVHWEHVKTYRYDPVEPKLILHISPSKSTFWIAHCAPYTNETLAKLRNEIGNHPDFHEEKIGKTVGGRDLLLWTITHGTSRSKKTIWLLFRQHSWESGSSWVAEGAIRTLLADRSRKLREEAIWKIIPLCDPDGVARGGVRFNANGYDLNRNWDVIDPIKMPEIAAQRSAVQKWLQSGHSIDLFLSLHNTETNEYLEGPPEGGRNGRFKPLAERLFRTLTEQTSFAPAQPIRYAGETTTPGKPGRMTVIQGLYRDFGIPGFLMEQRISDNAKLGKLPDVPDRLQFGAELVQALAKSIVR